ncbi:hypothetical protein B0O99DRAFT_521660 [Bisporella sp. PMI_857]|nr:hypothetical protein B0O99DRAFT_521660 [Bisporella sp. PMI_857]
MISRRLWNLFVIAAILSISLFFFWSHGVPTLGSVIGVKGPARPPGPIYKHKSKAKPVKPINDNFPLLDGVVTGKLPAIPSWNQPPTPHAEEKTPLFIGFTRNWPLLQQCVLGYIAAGWPPEDIYVVDNTGTMKSNFPPNPKITLQNPFFLNVQRLTNVFGVNVISTPTLLTFAQLQNFYISTSMDKGWDYFFWSHMDVLPIAEEAYEGNPYKSLYVRALDKLKEVSSPDYLKNPETGVKDEWGIQFFAYDWLALNNVKSFLKVGAWDTFVSFYTTDCDMHGRFTMNNIKMPAVDAGRINDVGGSIDLSLLFRKKIDLANPPKTVAELDAIPEDERGGLGFEKLLAAVEEQKDVKKQGERNKWQYRQTGGKGEPFYRDPDGFEQALQMMIDTGVKTYQAKWGHKECNLPDVGLRPDDAWMVEKDFR